MPDERAERAGDVASRQDEDRTPRQPSGPLQWGQSSEEVSSPWKPEGRPLTHAEYTRQRAEDRRAAGKPTIDNDPHLECPGVLEIRGIRVLKENGRSFVLWRGDDLWREVTCPVCGYEMCAPTGVKGARNDPVEAPREEQPF